MFLLNSFFSTVKKLFWVDQQGISDISVSVFDNMTSISCFDDVHMVDFSRLPLDTRLMYLYALFFYPGSGWDVTSDFADLFVLVVITKLG